MIILIVLALVKVDNTMVKPIVKIIITASLAIRLLRELHTIIKAKRRRIIGNIIKNLAACAINGWEIMCTFGSLKILLCEY